MLGGSTRGLPPGYSLLSTRTLPRCRLSLKNSLTEQPARPEDAHAQAQAQLEAQAQLDAQEEAQEEAHEERGLDPPPDLRDPLPELREPPECLTGTLITFTWMKVLGLLPYL